jgi:glycosyltransferase involved in cell wall biosynthesis
MKILQVLEFNQFNTGSVHQMFQAAAGMRERGHEVVIATRPDPVMAAKAAEHGIRHYGFPFRHQFDLTTVRGLRKLLREEQPDVIHAHKGIAHGLTLLASYGHAPGAFVVNRGVSFPLDRWNRSKYRTPRVDKVVTVCRQIKDVIVESGKLPDEKVQVVYAGTDVTHFDPEKWDHRAFRREKHIADDAFVVAQVGVRDWKGWMELIDSVSDVAPKHPNIQLLLIGCRTQKEKDEVEGYARKAGVGAHVTGIEYRTDMPNVFASCDLVVDASWAGTGITGTVREAMAMAKPVIATSAGGNGELVSSPEVGFLIPMKDRAALTNALLAVIENPSRSAELGRAARAHVVRGFSKELRLTRLENLYAAILASKATP